MKTFALTAACVFLGSVAGAAGAATLLGPEGEFSTFLGKLKYDPSAACTKPFRPFSKDSSARREYIASAQRYLECMQDAAISDARYASEVIAEGLEEASDDFLSEVELGY